MRVITLFLSTTLCMIAATMTTTKRGFYIRVDRGNYQTELKHAWSDAGQLPQEWQETKADPTVVEAQLFRSTQRNRQHNKRKILDRYPSE